jgi:hypothetical protein
LGKCRVGGVVSSLLTPLSWCLIPDVKVTSSFQQTRKRWTIALKLIMPRKLVQYLKR